MYKKALLLIGSLVLLVNPLFGRINLDKNTWHIKQGFQQNWKNTDYDFKKDGGWIPKQGVPIRAQDLKNKGNNNIVTYTFITDFKSSEVFIKTQETKALFLPSIGEVWQIFLNGKIIADELHLKKDGSLKKNRFVRGGLIDFPTSLLKENNRLVIRVTGDRRYWGTGLHLSPGYTIGYFHKLQNEKSELIIFMIITLYLLVGGYHIMLFVKRPKERYNLYFGLFGSLIFIYFITRSNYVFNIISDAEVVMRVEHIVLFPVAAILLAFFETLFFDKESIVTKIIAAFVGVLTILALFVPVFIVDIILKIWQGLAMIIFFIVIYYVIKALKNKVKEARTLVVGIFVLFLTATFDIVDSVYLSTGFAVTKYGLFFLVMGIATILSNRFVRVYNEAEDLNINLENKVKERTLELKLTLEEVQELKEQQDGDYYLTSLLMEPLSYNDVRSNSVFIDDLTIQKKQFTFRKKEVDIGGDLSVATTIRLQNKDYIAFINSDAMGKSIQGAGGALITGVIYNSYISRIKKLIDDRTLYPELWLRDCFIDLQNVFSSFDGQMLTSCIMGLVDESTGLMYYINAEHPHPVLFRNGKASFIGEDVLMRKIGMAETEELTISTFQLHPGDKVIIGSDGKDDIITGYDEGVRIINEDEKKYLSYVEKSLGKIADIKGMIFDSGEVMDDLSLVSISFMPVGEKQVFRFLSEDQLSSEVIDFVSKSRIAAEQGNNAEAMSLLKVARDRSESNPFVLKEIVRIYLKDGKYVAASEVALQFADLAPWDVELLYLASYACKLGGNYTAALECGQRYYLRHKNNIKNILNLADIYRIRENKERALFYLKKAGEISPGNDNVSKLQNLVQAL